MIVGIDIGYGFVKVITSDNRKLRFPTWIAVAHPGAYTELPTYNLDGTQYWLGESALHGERFEITTVEDLIRFYPLFRRYVLDLLEIDHATIITGLPPKDYFSEEGYRSKLQDTVLWQGFGILVDMKDHLTDANSVAVLDIGFNTLDYVITQRIQNKWHKIKVGSIPQAGLMRAINIFKEILPSSLSFIKTANKQALIQVFESRKIKHFGETINLSQFIDKAVQEYNTILDNLINTELDLSTVDKLIIAGGGAYYYRHKHKNLLIPPEPEFSNARGYLKWAESLQEQKR